MRPLAGVPAHAVARVSVELIAIRFLLVSAVVFPFGCAGDGEARQHR